MEVEYLIEKLEKKVRNVEKRIIWAQRDLSLYKAMIAQYGGKRKKNEKIQQLELFGS